MLRAGPVADGSIFQTQLSADIRSLPLPALYSSTHGLMLRLARENINSFRGMLKLVRLTLDDLYVLETGCLQITSHLPSLKQAEIDRDCFSVPLVAMQFSFAAVKRQEQFSVRG